MTCKKHEPDLPSDHSTVYHDFVFYETKQLHYTTLFCQKFQLNLHCWPWLKLSRVTELLAARHNYKSTTHQWNKLKLPQPIKPTATTKEIDYDQHTTYNAQLPFIWAFAMATPCNMGTGGRLWMYFSWPKVLKSHELWVVSYLYKQNQKKNVNTCNRGMFSTSLRCTYAKLLRHYAKKARAVKQRLSEQYLPSMIAKSFVTLRVFQICDAGGEHCFWRCIAALWLFWRGPVSIMCTLARSTTRIGSCFTCST